MTNQKSSSHYDFNVIHITINKQEKLKKNMQETERDLPSERKKKAMVERDQSSTRARAEGKKIKFLA